MNKLAVLLAAVMLIGFLGCTKADPSGEAPEESTTGTSTEISSSSTEKPREILIYDDFDGAYPLLQAYIYDSEQPENMPNVVDVSVGQGWEGFMPYYEDAQNGEDFAVVIQMQNLMGDGYALTYLSGCGGSLFYLTIRISDGEMDYDWRGGYTSIICIGDFHSREFWLADREDYTYDELVRCGNEEAIPLFSIENAALRSVDLSIDTAKIPLVTNDFEQIKALLYAYGDGTNVPENFPPVYTWDDEYENAEAFLEFYEKAMKGTECSVVCRMKVEDGSFELQYVAYKDGTFLYVRDTTRRVSDNGKTGKYTLSAWSYLVKFEDVSVFSVIYMLVNDDTATYEQIRDSMYSSDSSKWIANQWLYFVRKE